MIEMQLQTTVGELDVVNFKAGKQAQCLRLNPTENIVVPSILKVAGEGKGYTRDEIAMLVSETEKYRKELTAAGIKLPDNYRLDAVAVEDEHHIVMVDAFIGEGMDGKQVLNGLDALAGFDAVAKMVAFLHDLPPHPEFPFGTAVMGDFKPDNWVLEGNDIYFVDYFAPKRYGKDGLVSPYMDKIDTFDREAITFMCGDRRGQITRLLAQINMSHHKYIGFAIAEGCMQYKDMPDVLAYIEEEVAGEFSRMDSFYKLKPGEWAFKI